MYRATIVFSATADHKGKNEYRDEQSHVIVLEFISINDKKG
jgi:hypothetical protein